MPNLVLRVEGQEPTRSAGPSTYVLVDRTATGWTLTPENASASVAASVTDEGHLLEGLDMGARITFDGVTECVPFSGCKSYQVVTDAADGTLIAASYDHDQPSALQTFAAMLGVDVTLEPLCRATTPDRCYPDAVDEQNALRFAGNSNALTVGTEGPVTIGGATVRGLATALSTLHGGSPTTTSLCGLDAGSLWRGRQTFRLAR